MVIEEAANETSRNNSRCNSVISSSSSDSSSSDGQAANRAREQVYEPLGTGAGAGSRTRTGPSSDAISDASPGSCADADDTAAPYKARRMPTTATNATVPDELAPNTEEEEEAIAPPKKSLMERLGLDAPTLMMMFKWVSATFCYFR